MKQSCRVLLLIYLFWVSVKERDYEDFGIIIEHLYYLSHFKTFNDAFISSLAELSS